MAHYAENNVSSVSRCSLAISHVRPTLFLFVDGITPHTHTHIHQENPHLVLRIFIFSYSLVLLILFLLVIGFKFRAKLT